MIEIFPLVQSHIACHFCQHNCKCQLFISKKEKFHPYYSRNGMGRSEMLFCQKVDVERFSLLESNISLLFLSTKL
jgi:hypothetical protein